MVKKSKIPKWALCGQRGVEIYTEWANHYLDRGHYKRCVHDLRTDVADGVLLADVVEAVIGLKVPDVERKPQDEKEMVRNIDSCLSFLDELGVSIQNITSKDIKEGSLKAILSLFFNLSRYKQARKENSAAAGNVPKENKPKLQRPVANSSTEMPSKLPSPFKPISRESSPASISHIPAPTTGNASRKVVQPERISKNGNTTGLSGTSGAAPKPPQTSTSNPRPTSFIPQPRGQRTLNSIRPPSVNTLASTDTSQLPGKQAPTPNRTLAGEGKNTHNSMFDKFKLFNSKDKSGAKAHLVTKRTSSSSGVSSAQSERSDSSTSLCSESKTSSSTSSNNIRPSLKNAAKKCPTSKPAPSKISTTQAVKNETKKPDTSGTSGERPKPQQVKKVGNIKKSLANGPNVKKQEKEPNASDKAPPENPVVQEEKKPEANIRQNGTLENTLDHSKSPASQSNNSIHSSKLTSGVQNDITSHQSKILTTQSPNLAHSKVPPSSSCQLKSTSCKNDDKAAIRPDIATATKQKMLECNPPKVPFEKASENNSVNALKDPSAQMSPPSSLLPKPTAAVKGTSKPSKSPQSNNQDVYVPVQINPEIQPEGKLNKNSSRNDVSIAMVSPILNSTANDNLKLETTFDSVDKVITSTNKAQESYSEEADDIVVNIKPMPPIIRSSAYGYMRSLGPLTSRLRLQTEMNGGRIGYSRQILADTNRIYNMKKSLVGGGSLLDGDYLSDIESVDIASGYMSDGDILRPGAVCHLDDIASGYLSEGGNQSFYIHRSANGTREPTLNNTHRHTNVYQTERQRQYNQSSPKFCFEDSSSLSSGISDTVAEFSTDDITSSSMSSDNNQFSNLKRTTHAPTCKLSLPSSSDKHQSGTKSHSTVNDGSKSRSNIKKTDSSMQTESSAFHNTAVSMSLKKHQHEQLKSDSRCESEKLKTEGECSKIREKKSSSSAASSSSKKSGTSNDSHKSRHKSSKGDDGKQKTSVEIEYLSEKPPRSSRNPSHNESLHRNDPKKALSTRSAISNTNYSVSKRSNAVHPTPSCGNIKPSNKLSVGSSNSKKILEKPCDSTKVCEMTETPMEPSHLMLQRCGTVPGCSSSRSALDMKGKLKVCANTQTTMHDLCVTTHSDSEYSSLGRKYSPKHYLLASPISLKERVYSNRIMPNGNPNSSDYVLLSGLSGSHEHRPRLSVKSSESDNYLRLDLPPSSTSSSHYAWLRHSPSAAMSIASAPATRLYTQGALTEAESMESLSSTTSSVHAQIQHARANSLTHARLMMHQRELSASPRLSRSNSIRSTKSEKLYPSMLQRSDDADSAIGCSASMSGYSANGSNSSHTSQPTSPISLTQGGTRIFPMLHVAPPISASNNTQPNSRSSNSMSHYMGGLLSKINNKDDDLHGSSLSLVSSTSSIYSSAEEKQAHEIKKLKRELDQAHEKVTTLTSQLTTNAHMVAAFEQSLSNMTTRLQHLTATAEQKDSELMELRTTIEALKKQSAEAGLTKMALQSMQAVQRTLQEHRISRQFSSESMSSANSASNPPSIRIVEANAIKKKKKKSWFKSSFSRAFSRSKKNKNGSVSDVEDMHQFQSDSSTPNSPLLGMSNHLGIGNFAQTMKLSHSSSAIYDKDEETTPEAVTDLKKQLREKDMVLTDIRLDALTSAHRLESLKETVNKMKVEMMNLKQDNDRLQQIASNKSLASSQASLLDSHSENLEKRLSVSECTEPSIADLQTTDTSVYPDGKRITVSVFLGGHGDYEKYTNHSKEAFIGSIFVSNKTKWDLLDNMVKKIFKEYLFRIDPISNLGLSAESIHSYHIGDITRSKDSDLPELLPCGYFVGDNAQVQIVLKGTKQNSIDALTFEILIPKLIVHRYVSLLTDHHRIILCGPSGTGKTYIAQKLAEYLVLRSGKELSAGAIATFSVDHKSAKELRQYLSNIAEQCESSNPGDLPSIIILDNLHHVGSLAEVFNGFLSAKYQKCPYIIGTMNQATCSTTNLQLHHNFRWVLCANHMEPVKGLLGRYLRKKLIEEEVQRGKSNPDLNKVIDWMPKVWQHLNKFLETHSSSDVTIGPRLFLSCPMDVENSQVWFTDLWNYSLIPYLLEAVREGLQLYGRRAPWEDPVDWVHTSYPWPAPSVGEWPQLLRLRPEDVGYDGHPGPGLSTKHIHSNASEVDGDPLLNMLMRLQEAATYSSPLSNENECSRLDNKIHAEEFISSGLESTL